VESCGISTGTIEADGVVADEGLVEDHEEVYNEDYGGEGKRVVLEKAQKGCWAGTGVV